MRNYETMEQSGHAFFCRIPYVGVVLRDLENNSLSVWFSNRNHASYGIIYNNTHLEFARLASDFDIEAVQRVKPDAVIEHDPMHACYRVRRTNVP